MKNDDGDGRFSGKVIASLVVLICIAVGLVGLVLPVIPGVLFLAIAALIAARHFPSVDARLRKHRALGRHMQTADGFFRLGFALQIQVVGWLCARMLLDGVAFIAAFVTKRA
jgi:uncharacterized membrane protein YbaN (DUF454 family)